MANHRRKHSQSVNMRLPTDLTQELLERLSQLPPSPKTKYLLEEVSSKFVSSETDSADLRRQRAIDKWLATEQGNAETNERLLDTHEEYNILPRVTFARFVSTCRDIILDILGSETVPTEALVGSFSGGASTSRNRTESHPAFKYLGEAHVTRSAFSIFASIADELPGWLARRDLLTCEFVPGNVLFTVPKKTDIDRVACKEPDINMFLQKGIGSYIRKRLRRFGIDLNDQSRNRELARLGSITRQLATLDLSSASDSIATGLVQLLLPEHWFYLLDDLRSSITSIPQGDEVLEHRNQMFSSMGNGFTFELESLLFFAITKATCYLTGTPGVVSVYGDDIICPTEIVEPLIWVLSFCGFRVNPDKSHWKDDFRESCGGHYLSGYDITPFYIKEPITTLDSLIDVANKLRKWGTGYRIIDADVEPIWLWLKSMVPRYLWGGADTSFKFQLVSYDTPHMRLQEETRMSSTGVGGYVHWLNATWARATPSDGIATSSKTTGLGRFRLRKVRDRDKPQLDSLFIHEYESYAE